MTGTPDRPALPLAVIDLGSNSLRLLVARITAAGSQASRPLGPAGPTGPAGLEVLADRGIVSRLADRLAPGGVIDPTAEARTAAALGELAAEARRLGARPIALATEALRRAGNGPAVAARLAAAAGCPVLIIDARTEAELTLAGSADLAPAGPRLLWDVGGGSTEVVQQEPGGSLTADSYPIGCVVYDGPEPAADWETAVARTAARFPAAAFRVRASLAVAFGGTATALAALDLGLERYRGERVHGHELTGRRLEEWGVRLAVGEPRALATLARMEPGRELSIAAGTVILAALTRRSRVERIRVSARGLRFGYLERAARGELGGLGATPPAARLTPPPGPGG